jgi:membrane-bound lytic murein transglycosylase F
MGFDRCLTKSVNLKKVISVLLICLVSLSLTVVFGEKLFRFILPKNEMDNDKGKLEKILSEKELRVVLDFNTINYFIYKGEPKGFQYDLLKEFCADNNLKLTITVSNDLSKDIDGLVGDEYDLVAKNVVAGYSSSEKIDYTLPINNSKIVLVQRINLLKKNVVGIKGYHNFVDSRSELMGKEVHVSSYSSLVSNIIKLNNDLGNSINVIADSIFQTGQLISQVAAGRIDFTVCDEATGDVLKGYYPNLDFSTPIAFDQKYCWAVQKKSPEWKRFLDNWIENFKQSDRYDQIVQEYYSDDAQELFNEREYNSFIGGRLSEYDEVIKDVSRTFEFDWRLVTSIILKESKFDSDVTSHKGASGLMQLMPRTAKLFNVFDTSIPRENIRGGVAYLSWLDELFMPIIPKADERIKFVLAAYNAGIGHVMDARRLAMKYNYDPSVWEGSVEDFLLKKSDPEFYNDPVVEHGYCRGSESLSFVNKVLDRYEHYVNIIPSDEKTSIAAL